MSLFDPSLILGWLTELGPWSGLAFAAAQALQVVVFWLPGTPFEVAGGMLFGPWEGMLLSSLGLAVGNAVAFALARFLGRRRVDTWLSTHKHPWVERLVHHPRLDVILAVLFFLPALPKDVFCYLAGFSNLGWKRFLLITTLARLPGLFLSSWLGSVAVHGMGTLFVGVLVASAVLASLVFVYRRSLMAALVRS